MKDRLFPCRRIAPIAFAMLLISPTFSAAQVPVDEDGNVIGSYEPEVTPSGDAGHVRLSATELEELVGPIALYPDDLLAIVLPASAYPLQIVEAARFLEAHKNDPSLEPDSNWDDTVIALINYPEVVELLNNDLDWTYRLGEAVVDQQSEVVAAIESFRDRAYASGNLKSDSYQTVTQDDGVIEISPVADDVIYVPYYEPERVVVYQPRPAYFYYPRPYPVYYYPYSSGYYSSGHYFDHGYFWGLTTAFSIGWLSDSLHVHHHSYHGHPFYGRHYRNWYWYRRPSISVYNTHYIHNTGVTINRYSNGDRWRARNTRRTNLVREGYARTRNTGTRSVRTTATRRSQVDPVRFRERAGQPVANLRESRSRDLSTNRRLRREVPASTSSRNDRREQIERRSRDSRQQGSNARSRDAQRQEIEFRSRDSQRQRTPARSRNTQRQQVLSQSRDSNRQQVVRQSRRNQDVRRSREPVRETRERRSQPVRQQAPSRRDSSRSESRTREQPSQSRSQRKGGSAEAPKSRSEKRSSRSRDRKR